MGHADKSEFQAVNIAVLTVSDTRTLDDDRSGDILVDRLQAAGHTLAARAIVKDDQDLIAAEIKKFATDDGIEVILTTGGTGLTGRDVTPEALAQPGGVRRGVLGPSDSVDHPD